MNTLAPILGDLGTAQAIFLIGLALLIVMLLIRSRRYFRQVTQYQVPRPDEPAAPALRQQGHAGMPPHDFERWEVAMHDLARDLSGQLDSKIRVLELLIREADKVAARLETALARTRSGAERIGTERNGPERNGNEPARETTRPAAGTPNQKNSAEMPSAATGSPPKNPPARSSTNSTATRTATASSPPIAVDKPRFDRIYALADAGLSPATIANQIGSQIGEVELILGIRGKGSEARGQGSGG